MRLLYTLLSLTAGVQASYVPLGMDDALTTSNIPERFLDNAGLVGSFPLIASRSDPRISYAMYVPPEHYHPEPNSTHGKLPLVVDIHGTGRSISGIWQEDQHPAFAQRAGCAVLAPLFPAGLEGPNDVDSYKSLRTESLRSDLALLNILDEVAYRWSGIETGKIYLMGFSGGGQFAHRFLYLHTDRLAAVSVGAPGSVTYIDEENDWPVGTADAQDWFNTSVDIDAIRQIPIHMIVGDEDNVPEDPEFLDWLEEMTGGSDLPRSNDTRVETIQKLHDSWEEQGIEAQLEIASGVGHDGAAPEIRGKVYDFLQDLLEAA